MQLLVRRVSSRNLLPRPSAQAIQLVELPRVEIGGNQVKAMRIVKIHSYDLEACDRNPSRQFFSKACTNAGSRTNLFRHNHLGLNSARPRERANTLSSRRRRFGISGNKRENNGETSFDKIHAVRCQAVTQRIFRHLLRLLG